MLRINRFIAFSFLLLLIGGYSAQTEIASADQEIPYGVELIQANQLGTSADGSGITVCIIDSGIENHEDLPFVMIGKNYLDDDHWYIDSNDHGTIVAGIIAAQNNDVGTVGIAPGVNLIIADVADAQGSAVLGTTILTAAEWCRDQGANIINFSLGTLSGGLDDGFKQLYDDNVLLIAASGNQGTTSNSADPVQYPASYPSVISVGSIDQLRQHAATANENEFVELVAPGASIFSSSAEPDHLEVGLGTIITGTPIEFGNIFTLKEAPLVDGGLCNASEVGDTWAGAIVLCNGRIGILNTLLADVLAKGAVGVVIYNATFRSYGQCCAPLPVLMISADSAKELQNNWLGTTATLKIGSQQYRSASGTSFASPYVTGAAALLWSACPSLTADQLRSHLSKFSQDLGESGREISYGWGLIQLRSALYGLADGIDTYDPTQPNADGSRPSNVECSTPVDVVPLAVSLKSAEVHSPWPISMIFSVMIGMLFFIFWRSRRHIAE